MGRKAKRARVLARIERLLGSETPAQQPSHVSNSEMQAKLKESKKQEEKRVEKVVEEVVSTEPTPVISEEVPAKVEEPKTKAKPAPKRKTTRKPRGSSKKS